MVGIPPYNFRQYTERRIIDNDSAGRIFFLLVISIRIKRTNEIVLLQVIFFRHPIRDGCINGIRSIAIICRFLCLELVQEFIVLAVTFLTARIVPLMRFKPIICQFFDIKTKLIHVDIKDTTKLIREQFRHPISEFADLIVHETESFYLFGSQVIRDNAGHGCHP